MMIHIRREPEPREHQPRRTYLASTTAHQHTLPEPVIRPRDRPSGLVGLVPTLAARRDILRPGVATDLGRSTDGHGGQNPGGWLTRAGVIRIRADQRLRAAAGWTSPGTAAGEPGSPHRPKKARCGRDSASDIRRPADVSPGRGAHGWGMKVNGIEKSTPVDRPVWLEQPDAHDQWNFMARRETPTQRLDRNYAEILQEVRVAQTGVQLLIAPAAFHRLVFQRRLKRQLVLASSRFAMFGLALLMLSINSALLLILSVTVGPEVAIWITAGALGWFVLWWYAVPLWSRVKHSGSHRL